MGVCGQCHIPATLLTIVKGTVPIVQEAGWAPGPVWMDVEKPCPKLGFDPRTVRLIVSHYTD